MPCCMAQRSSRITSPWTGPQMRSIFIGYPNVCRGEDIGETMRWLLPGIGTMRFVHYRKAVYCPFLLSVARRTLQVWLDRRVGARSS